MSTAEPFDLPSPPEKGAAFEAFVPLDEVLVPAFPLDALSTWQRDFVEAAAEATQTPPDLPGVLSCCAVATACAGRARVQVREGYTEPLNIYASVAMPPAARKSEVFRLCLAPLTEWERDAAEIARPRVARALEELELLRGRLAKVRKSTERGDNPPAEAQACDLAELIAAREAALPVMPRLVVDDATPESLGSLLERHDGRMALWAPEGGELFAMVGGRYAANGAPNMGVYLQGHAGDPIRVDRRAREVRVERPALTLALCVQPAVIEKLRDTSAFRERGLLARFLYSMPESTVGRRDWKARPMPAEIARTYRESLRALLDRAGAEAVLDLEPAALDAWLTFARDLEPRLAEDGDLGPVADWAGKLPGLIARLAGLLCVAEWSDARDPFAQPVDAAVMRRALELGRYALEHARAAFALMTFDPREAAALKLWRYIARRSLAEVTHQELWQATKGGRVATSADLEAAIGVLVSHGYLRPMGTNGAGPRAFRVNPEALAHEGGARGIRGTHA